MRLRPRQFGDIQAQRRSAGPAALARGAWSIRRLTGADRAALLVVTAVIGLRATSATTADLAYIVLAIHAARGRAQVVQALALSWLLSMFNSGLAPDGAMSSIGRYAVVVAGAGATLVRSILRGTIRISPGIGMTLVLGVFLIVHSLLFSEVPDVSLSKALVWTTVFATLLAAWGGLHRVERERLETQVFGGLAAVLILSLPLLGSGAGYAVNGTGFQGILGHPQAFGPSVAFFAAWVITRELERPVPRWRAASLLCAALACIIASEARTAGLSLVIGVIVAVVLMPVTSRISLRKLAPGLLSGRVQLALLVGVVALVVASPFVAGRLRQYLHKRTDAASLSEAYDASRGELIRRMWSNVQQRPLEGIGFGVGSEPLEMIVHREPLFGIPVSALVEKGVLPLAVIEELGIVGALAAIVWLLVLARSAFRSRSLRHSAVLCTALATNAAEATLFSPGGMGLIVLVLVAWAAAPRPPLSSGERYA